MKESPSNKYQNLLTIFGFTIVGIIAFFISAKLDAFEAFAEWIVQHEQYNFDEFIIVFLVWFLALFIFTIVRNRTIQKQKRRLSELSSMLQQSLDKKDKLFSILGHDLKSPFNSLIGFSELLLKKENTMDNDKKKEMLSIINNTAKRTLNLLTNLLDWARLETNNITPEKEVVDLSLMVANEIGLLQSIAHNKNVLLKNQIPEGTTAYVDENMICTVIRNLISNAIKYSYDNGTVSASVRSMENFIEVSISDSGIGITPEKLKDLFLKVGISTPGTNKESGTGLGLKICKDFVEKNNGELLVKSIAGSGTDFIFTVPTKE